MCTILTQHVRNFGPSSFPGDDILGRLRSLLRRQMRRRGLLGLPPSYLGYMGVPSWRDEGAFDDIVMDCYQFAILARLAGLRNRAQFSDNIDPLIVRNINFFLDERHRTSNPLGYAVYCNLRVAEERAWAQGLVGVHGLRNGRAVRRSRIVFGTPPCTSSLDQAVLRQHLHAMPGWEEALPGLVGTTQAGQTWLLRYLVRLQEQQPGAVHLGALADVIEERVRAAWAGGDASQVEAVPTDEGDLVELVRVVQPDTDLENRDHWREIVARVRTGLPQERAETEARGRLLRIFDAIVLHVERDSGKPFRQADLCRALHIPGPTMCCDIRVIRGVVDRVTKFRRRRAR
jgi:hypothetical protein